MDERAIEELVDWLAADPPRTGLFLDFDGTLAPIVDDPSASAMHEGLDAVLPAVAKRLGALTIVSGRPAAFLGRRAPIEGARLLGLYGLEEWRDGRAHQRPEAARWRPAIEKAKERLSALAAGIPGARLEDKGLGVALHWRGAEDESRTGRAVAEAVQSVASATGLAREPGKLVEELRPPVSWDKGSSVRALASELDLARVAYVGDDLGDLAAFAAARDLGGMAVAVDHGDETPRELLTAADVVLDGTAGVQRLVTALSDRLDRREAT